MTLEAADVPPLLLLLSPERLGALTMLTGSSAAAIELHQETLRLGTALMHLTATMEIALRNAVCENLTAHFGVPNWLTQPPVSFRWRDEDVKKVQGAVDSARRAKYAKLSQDEKAALDPLAFPQGRPASTSHIKRVKDRRRHIVVTEGQVVAELTLYFWKRLYGPDYEQTLWRTTLKRTFPNKQLSRATVASRLESLYQMRNRIAHHEPVLHRRFSDLIDAVTFIAQNLETSRPNANSPLAKLIAADLAGVIDQAASLHAKLDSFRVASTGA